MSYHQKLKLLVIDDEQAPIDAIDLALEMLDLANHVEWRGCRNLDLALHKVKEESFDVVICDFHLNSDIEAAQIFRRAKLKNPLVTLALMTGDADAEKFRTLFDSLNLFFIEKPIESEKLKVVFDRAKLLLAKKDLGHFQPKSDDPTSHLIAESPSMKAILKDVKAYGKDKELAIHFAGPTGTGKSTLAKIVHKISGSTGPFVTVTCSAIPQNLASSALFGHVKGAFTGAIVDKEGAVAQANGGTLFLDEFHLLPKDVQASLLRVLNEGIYQRVGDSKERSSSFRLVTAASVELRLLIESKDFMEDLYFRACKKTLHVPRLSERRACIPKLVYSMLREREKKQKITIDIEPAALDLLMSFSWDGNIRDLQNSIDALCAPMSESGTIQESSVRDDLRHRRGLFTDAATDLKTGESLSDALTRFEKHLIENALTSSGSVQKASLHLGIPRGTLRSRIERLNIRASSR